MSELKDDQFKKAWANLTASLGNDAPKQIKNSIFLIQNRLLIYPNPELAMDADLKDAVFDLKQLYDFMDEVELQTN